MQVVTIGNFEALFGPVRSALRERDIDVVDFGTPEAFANADLSMLDPDVIYAVGQTAVTGNMMEKWPNLRALICPFIGYEGFDKAAANDLGIIIGNGQVPENYQSMAEATVMLMLACLYDLGNAEARLRHGTDEPAPRTARMLKGKTVGLIGFGQMARAVAERLAGWQAELITYAPRIAKPIPASVTCVELGELLTRSDVVCVLASLNPESYHLLDDKHLGLIKQGAILINVSRGGLIDEEALYRRATAGQFSKVALDVFETEPLPLDSPLRTLPNAILTPHSIGHTLETRDIMPVAALKNVLQVIAGEPPLYVANPEILPRWLKRWSNKGVDSGKLDLT